LVHDNARFATADDLPQQIDWILAAVAAPPTRPHRRRAPAWIAAGGTLVAIAVTLMLVIQVDQTSTQALDGRRKGGGVDLGLIRRTPAGRIDPIESGSKVSPGDAVRFRIITPHAGYVGVLGLDAAQVVTAYAPDAPTLPPIAAGTPVVLDGSIILDDTLGPETMIAVVCDAPRPVASLIAEGQAALAAAKGDPRRVGRVTRDCQEAVLLVEKVAR
jgi:hypothetical protein